MKKTDLLAQAIKAKDGAAEYPEIAFTRNTTAKIQTDLSAASAAEAEYQTAVAAIVPLQQAYLAAIANAYTFAQRAKDVLKPHCGNQHCDMWNAAGFANGLSIPPSWNGLRILLASLGTFFSANAAKEVAALLVIGQLCVRRMSHVIARLVCFAVLMFGSAWLIRRYRAVGVLVSIFAGWAVLYFVYHAWPAPATEWDEDREEIHYTAPLLMALWCFPVWGVLSFWHWFRARRTSHT